MSAVERLEVVIRTWPGVRLAVLYEVALRIALSRAAEQDVDVVMLDTAPPLLRFEIARDGRPLFEGRPHAWADFRARAMIDWWDWAPTWRAMQAAAVNRLRQRVADGPS